MRALAKRVLRTIGRGLQPLLDPDHLERARALAATDRQLKDIQVQVAHAAGRVDRMSRRVDTLDRTHVDRVNEAVAALQHNTRRQQALLNRVTRTARQNNAREVVRDRVFERLHRLARRRGPILVGPWTGEVGFELLYWVPFVRWALNHFRIDPSRVTLFSRGGSESWYGLEGARYVDVFDLTTPEDFRAHTAGRQKQRTLRHFDRELIRRVARASEAGMGLLHPAMMYALYKPYWSEDAPSRWVHQLAEHRRITPPLIPGMALPRDYVAARFYFSKCFPDTPENHRFVTSLITTLAADADVVLLTPRLHVDEHRDVPADAADRVHTIDHLIRPDNNLAVQTAVVAGARAFIGTYGGFSYLAPLCGVNTVALYSRRTYFPYHLDFAQHVFDEVQGGSLAVADTATWPLLHAGA